MTRRSLLRALITAATFASVSALAQASESGRPTAAEIVDRLAPHALTRSLPVGGRGISIENAAPEPPPSIDLDVNFAFNSAALTTDARLTLNQLGAALRDPRLATARLRIAGHTDAVGSDAFNQRLSERRAAAVCTYLTQAHRIAQERLDAVGYGRSHLRDPDHPTVGVNRRVEVVNLGATVAEAGAP